MRQNSSSDGRRHCCTYEGCGRTFVQKVHLYRHQREKHGAEYRQWCKRARSGSMVGTAGMMGVEGMTMDQLMELASMSQPGSSMEEGPPETEGAELEEEDES